MSPSNKKTARALQDAPKIISATAALMEELVRVLSSRSRWSAIVA